MKTRGSASPRGRVSSRQTHGMMAPRRGWKGSTLSRLRALVIEAEPAAIEEMKWKKPTNPAGVPVWYHHGIICTGGILKNSVRLTFLKGAQLEDPKRLFNASLEGNALRAIDFHEGDAIDEPGVKALVREAVRLNLSKTTAQ